MYMCCVHECGDVYVMVGLLALKGLVVDGHLPPLG